MVYFEIRLQNFHFLTGGSPKAKPNVAATWLPLLFGIQPILTEASRWFPQYLKYLVSLLK
jgi:hypothetical protein